MACLKGILIMLSKRKCQTPGQTEKALQYEVQDMQDYVWNHGGEENIAMVQDVMDILTSVRNQWGMVYPFE